MSVDNKVAFTILNPRLFVEIFLDYGHWNTKKSVSLTDSDVQNFLGGEGNQNKCEKKTENYVFSSFDNGISRRWERKSTTGRFATVHFWQFKDFFCL